MTENYKEEHNWHSLSPIEEDDENSEEKEHYRGQPEDGDHYHGQPEEEGNYYGQPDENLSKTPEEHRAEEMELNAEKWKSSGKWWIWMMHV